MKVDVEATARDEGFGMTVAVSVINAADGFPVPELDKENFRVTVVQSPNGWAIGDVLLIISGIAWAGEGCYAFCVAENNLTKEGKKLSPGFYTLSVTVRGSVKNTELHGQTLVVTTMK